MGANEGTTRDASRLLILFPPKKHTAGPGGPPHYKQQKEHDTLRCVPCSLMNKRGICLGYLGLKRRGNLECTGQSLLRFRGEIAQPGMLGPAESSLHTAAGAQQPDANCGFRPSMLARNFL